MQQYDVAVLGLGAIGAATVYHLASAGAKVIGIDRHHPPHDQGSSHGDTRIAAIGPEADTAANLDNALVALSAGARLPEPFC
ncbi:FAD-dependent oxidoreductase [Pseudomonas sp. G2-4]|uniref:FAD-dependent oxidoreductase n=1 Tax=Pseudomonas sp. G2-4 TaxID=1506334 RepID=UPI0024BA1C1F|nr:FAD-dependent oxidoreductase [Pseudomonas sp. G2-4]WHS58371.1 FAD-dependent oxidoreductase [Pseudomonas sp. G2-4]